MGMTYKYCFGLCFTQEQEKLKDIHKSSLHLQPLINHQQLHTIILVDQVLGIVLITSELKVQFQIWVEIFVGFFLNKTIGVLSFKLGVFITNICFIEFSRANGLEDRGVLIG